MQEVEAAMQRLVLPKATQHNDFSQMSKGQIGGHCLRNPSAVVEGCVTLLQRGEHLFVERMQVGQPVLDEVWERFGLRVDTNVARKQREQQAAEFVQLPETVEIKLVSTVAELLLVKLDPVVVGMDVEWFPKSAPKAETCQLAQTHVVFVLDFGAKSELVRARRQVDEIMLRLLLPVAKLVAFGGGVEDLRAIRNRGFLFPNQLTITSLPGDWGLGYLTANCTMPR
ncbi:hypothetical protein BASA81_003563 [Batrachochytrium salamandrivorans]|nr:hypothetical protein BASA81_003563 [Batrachochytrium salamandrivorans]